MSNDPLAQFRVATLRPLGPSGSAPTHAQSYELTRFSAHPIAVTGRDRLGRPIEETINIHYSQKWVHPSGTINNVPMRTGAIFSMTPSARAYEDETTFELLNEGWIPLRCCPYTQEWRAITRTKHLVDNPTNEPDCGGDEANGGCVHLKAIIAERKAAFRTNYELELEMHNRMNSSQAKNLLEQMTEALALANTVANTSEDEDEALPRPTPGAKGKTGGR